MSLQVLPIPALKDNYIWLIMEPTKQLAIIVDPGEAKPVLDLLRQQQLTLTAILLTHHHWDHCSGVKELVDTFSIAVYGPAREEITNVTHAVTENTVIQFPEFDLSLQILEIPGHTRGHIAYYGNNWLFCGDTLFAAGCGRLFEGTAEHMFSSLNKLKRLPEETQIHCGHEYTETNLKFAKMVEPHNSTILQRLSVTQALRAANKPTLPSTLREEKATNPFLRCDSPQINVSIEEQFGESPKDSIETFAYLRRWKDNFKA